MITTDLDSIPSITFLGKIQKELFKTVKQTVVVRLFANRLGYKGLKTIITFLWKPKREYHIIDLEKNLFLVCFTMHKDYLKVLLNSPWMTRGTYITIQLWSTSFSTKKIKTTSLVTWLRFLGLPLHYTKKA